MKLLFFVAITFSSPKLKFIPKGFFDEYRPMKAADIAKAIVQVAQDDHSEGVKIHSPVEYAK